MVTTGTCTSSTLMVNTGTPQGCVLSSALFTVSTHDCSATHPTDMVVKFANDTTVVGLMLDSERIPTQRGDPGPDRTVLRQQPCSEHQQDQGDHCGLKGLSPGGENPTGVLWESPVPHMDSITQQLVSNQGLSYSLRPHPPGTRTVRASS